jgi:GntR family transcriptional regulator, arabinose operon transcriptional repressor
MTSTVNQLAYKPKYLLIADMVREAIVTGTFKNGDQLPPDNQLANQYNINTRTLAAGLKILVNEGLLARAPRRGTIVIYDDQATPKTSNAVGMVMLSEGDVYSDITRSFSGELTRRGLFPALINNQILKEKGDLKLFMNAMVNEEIKPYGFFIDGALEFPFDFLKENIKKFHNVVFITKYHYSEKIPSAKYVLVDYHEAGQLAAKHFISQGHKRIACLAIHEKDYIAPYGSIQAQILQGFAEVCHNADIEFSTDIFWQLLHGAPFEETVGTLLADKKRPTAIFAYNDFFIRSRMIPLLKKYGLESMKDVEMIGFYNTHHAEECGFSSIGIREDEIASQAVAMLCGENVQEELLIKPELVIRRDAVSQPALSSVSVSKG